MPVSWLLRLREPRSLAVLLSLCAAFSAAELLHRDLSPSGFTQPEASLPASHLSAGGMTEGFASHATNRFVHAAAVTSTTAKQLFAVWFGGSREGAEDVQIFGAHFDRDNRSWAPEHSVIDRAGTELALGMRIRKLGNPVVGLAPDGKLWLFYVSVSLGGWATSNINFMTSTDNALTWSKPRRLVTTPFFNISTLVRGRPIFHADGSIGLPVYHEAIGKFPEYLRINTEGRVLDKVRLDSGRDTLQPYPVVLNENDAIFLLRDGTEDIQRVRISRSHDRGLSWSEPQSTVVHNPNAAVAAVRYSDSEVLVVLNDLESERYRLSAFLTDYQFEKWQRVALLENAPIGDGRPVPFAEFAPALAKGFAETAGPNQLAALPDYMASWTAVDARGCKRGACEFRYDYPYLIQTDADQFELVYSWNKSQIKHISMSRQWIEQRRNAANPLNPENPAATERVQP